MNSSTPLVSVCVITYNHERFLAQTLDGILMQQTGFSFEIVIGEDFSKDSTLEICKAYAVKYPDKINLLPSDRNHGLNKNFIRTLAACKGEYIALCEGDDYWTDPLKLRKQVDFFAAHPSVVFGFHGAQIFDESNKTFYPYYKHKNFTTGIIDKKWLFEKGGGSFCTPSAMFKRSVLKFPDWFVSAPTGDFPLMLMAIQAGDFGYQEDVMCVYRSFSTASWSASFKSFESYQRYFMEEQKMIDAFNHESGFKYKQWLDRLNYLRAYRLIIFYNRFHRSVLKRMGFTLAHSNKLGFVYFLKSCVNALRQNTAS